MLEHLGHRSLGATTGSEAIALLKGHPDEIHLFITDVHLPGVSGVTIAKQAREIRPGIKILLMSGGNNASGPAFIAKPFTLGMLSIKVRTLLDAPN